MVAKRDDDLEGETEGRKRLERGEIDKDRQMGKRKERGREREKIERGEERRGEETRDKNGE